MDSLGGSPKGSPYESSPCTPGSLFCETGHTQDEAKSFLEKERHLGVTEGFASNEQTALSGQSFTSQDCSQSASPKSENGQSELSAEKTAHVADSPGTDELASSPTLGDLACSRKCADMQRFIRPLLELLNGLKAGRFNKGLTSFQQSVAMDRLQRILGILQKPNMGEKYLPSLLQIEIMLKDWFPVMAKKTTTTATAVQSTATPYRSHWCQNQLHIPVKKRRLHYSDNQHPDSATPENCPQNRARDERYRDLSLDFDSSYLPNCKCEPLPSRGNVGQAEGSGQHTDSRGAPSMPSGLCHRKENASWKRSRLSSPSPCCSPVTQDNSVSSSSTFTSSEPP